MKNNNDDAVENNSGEVDRLQEELSKANERLQIWKEKTQRGVNELRGRIVELTTEVEELRSTNKRLMNQIPSASEPGETPVCPTPVSLSLCCPASEWLAAAADVFASYTLRKSSIVLEEMISSDATAKELEKCKRRAAQAMRLQAKNVEVLQEDISTLRKQLEVSVAEVQDRNRAVESRDQAIAVLQNRLDAMEAANVQLEHSYGIVINKPNADQLNMMEEQLETDMEFLRREFASREVVIFEQHRDEINRLLAMHEKEVSMLRAELEEVAATAASELPIPMDTELGKDTGDTAYAELLRDVEALRSELNSVRAENHRLTSEQQIRNARDRLGATLTNGNSTRHDPVTLPEAIARIAELESGTRLLSQELCEAKKRLIVTKHQASSRDAGQRTQALEGQQVPYLRFVVVRLISYINDEDMVRNLFPVLSTLLQFDSDNLREIFAAHPTWMKREF